MKTAVFENDLVVSDDGCDTGHRRLRDSVCGIDRDLECEHFAILKAHAANVTEPLIQTAAKLKSTANCAER